MLEPIIIPKLLIHFADFPYASFVRHRAPNPLVLMRFGTSARQLFTGGGVAVRLRAMLGTPLRRQVATGRGRPVPSLSPHGGQSATVRAVHFS